MNTTLLALKTDSTLLEALQKSASRKLTPKEILEQRVSFVFGSMDHTSDVTREQVKQLILRQEGVAAEAGK